MIYCSDPAPQNRAYQAELKNIFTSFLSSGSYIKGNNCQKFEENFANYIGTNHALGVGNATDALEISLLALGVGAGDNVITTSMTAVATVWAIKNVGANVVFADTEKNSFNIDIEDARTKIDENTKCIVAVHLHGKPCNIKSLKKLCCEEKILLIEDCSQAHGATYEGQKVGSFGDLSCFSFYPTKNLASLGDGGAILTNNKEVHEECRKIHQYGWVNRISVCENGRNSRLDELQAGVLNFKLNLLDEFNSQRCAIASYYNHGLVNENIELPSCLVETEDVFHQYVIRSSKRDKIRFHLKSHNIYAGLHYEHPVHLQPVFRKKGLSLLNTEKQSRELLSLPIYPGLSEEDCGKIIKLVSEALKNES